MKFSVQSGVLFRGLLSFIVNYFHFEHKRLKMKALNIGEENFQRCFAFERQRINWYNRQDKVFKGILF